MNTTCENLLLMIMSNTITDFAGISAASHRDSKVKFLPPKPENVQSWLVIKYFACQNLGNLGNQHDNYFGIKRYENF